MDETAKPEPKGIGSTKETWAIAIEYITGRKRAEEALGFLAEVSRVLASSVNYSETLAQVTQLVVPYLADRCSIELTGDNNAAQAEAAVACAEGLSPEWNDRIDGLFHSLTEESSIRMATVVESGQPILLAEVREVNNLSGAESEERRRFAELDVKSLMIVPLTAREEKFGAIYLISTESGISRRYGRADLALAQELARRVACAVEIGRLHRVIQALTEQSDSR